MLRIVALLALLLGLGHAALWWWLGGQLQAGALAWAASRRAEGWEVAHAPPQRAGWPWAAQLTVGPVRLVSPMGVGWQAEKAALNLDLPWPQALRLEAGGAQALLQGGTPLRFTTRAAQLGFALDGGGASLGLVGLVLPLDTPLGREVQAFAAQVMLSPPLPLPPLRAQASAWQQAGGRLTLPALALRFGPLAAAGSADLGLDAALQPAGTANIELAGLAETLDALVAAGWIPQGQAGAARLMLALLSRPDPAGGPPRLAVPLVVQGGLVQAAGLRLGRLPALPWPAP